MSNELLPVSEEEDLRAVRESDEKYLELLLKQKSLYARESDIPIQLILDIDIFWLRLAITGADGKKLNPAEAIRNIESLKERKILHSDGVANILIKERQIT